MTQNMHNNLTGTCFHMTLPSLQVGMPPKKHKFKARLQRDEDYRVPRLALLKLLHEKKVAVVRFFPGHGWFAAEVQQYDVNTDHFALYFPQDGDDEACTFADLMDPRKTWMLPREEVDAACALLELRRR